MSPAIVAVGDTVELTGFDDDCIVPDGIHVVSAVNQDGSFHLGGITAVYPHRLLRVIKRANDTSSSSTEGTAP